MVHVNLVVKCLILSVSLPNLYYHEKLGTKKKQIWRVILSAFTPARSSAITKAK